MNHLDIIAAIATPPGRGGIGIVRISGKSLTPVLHGLLSQWPRPRHALFTPFLDEHGIAIDHGIALYFNAPHSYTGEETLELQCHGGSAVLQLLLDRCLQLGARLAEPGEFTRRAYLNDKLDLLQAEAVADLIEASSAQAARSAMRSLTGEFSDAVHSIVEQLIELRMLVEATLDFPEEEIDFLQKAGAQAKLERIRSDTQRLLGYARQGALLRNGISAVLIGQPNVGKSSLLNRLSGEDVAIVTPIPGTTRDAINQVIHLEGVPVTIIDTAGLRDTRDAVEAIGISRTWDAITKADLAILVVDATQGITDADERIKSRLPAGLPIVEVFNKVDLVKTATIEPDANATALVSAKTGQGIDALRAKLLHLVGWQNTGEPSFLARARHVEALNGALRHYDNAHDRSGELELFAEELRLAQQTLSTITGEFTADDLLGEIFSRFCIGK